MITMLPAQGVDETVTPPTIPVPQVFLDLLQTENKEGSRSGETLGDYLLGDLLGTGGSAEVYLAEHRATHKQVAIKILSECATFEQTEFFFNEAALLASLSHSRIVHLLAFHEYPVPYLVMNYLPSGTLRQQHPEGSIVPPHMIINYVRQTAAALQYLHDHHIVHRDIKPENLLLDTDHSVIVGDFGIATTVSPESQPEEIALDDAVVVGTPKYMAPEAIEGHAQPASDQYALGALAYEWFCGTPPFTSDFLACLIYQHTSQPLPSLREKNEHIPQAVEKVIARALAKEPENRFPSVTAFASALERAVTHHQITAIHLQHWDEYGQSANDQSARSR